MYIFKNVCKQDLELKEGDKIFWMYILTIVFNQDFTTEKGDKNIFKMYFKNCILIKI
jgi:hypothetical protein